MVPAEPVREETTARIGYSDKRTKPPAPPPPAADMTDGWIELASATPARHGREFIVVGAGAGTFTGLRLSAASGHPGINSVRVDYADGSHKNFEIGKVLGARRRPAYVDLHGAREIRQVIVVSDRSSSGSYVLHASTKTDVALR